MSSQVFVKLHTLNDKTNSNYDNEMGLGLQSYKRNLHELQHCKTCKIDRRVCKGQQLMITRL